MDCFSSIKSYYTHILHDPEYQKFPKAQKYSTFMRKQYHQELLPSFLGYGNKDMLILLLAPLVFQFHNLLLIPKHLSVLARHVIMNVITSKQEIELKRSLIDTFLSEFKKFEKQDQQEFKNLLFRNAYELKSLRSLLDTEQYPELSVHIEDSIHQCLFYIEKTGNGDEWQIYQREKNMEQTDRLCSIMEKAFWDHFSEELQNGRLDTLDRTLTEIRDLLVQIPHPSIVSHQVYLEDLLDNGFILSLVQQQNLTQQQVKNIFHHLFTYMKECDSPSMDNVYENILHENESSFEDSSHLLIKFLPQVYTLAAQLLFKMRLLLET